MIQNVTQWMTHYSDVMQPTWMKQEIRALSIFLTLKVQVGDWDATMLSPSAQVDELWHALILDTKAYADFCKQFCPQDHFLHHRPSGRDEEDQGPRYLATYLLVRHYYVPEERAERATYWPCVDLDEVAAGQGEVDYYLEPTRAPKQRKVPITLHAKTLNGKTVTVTIDPASNTCSDLLDAIIAESDGSVGRSSRLIFAGKNLDLDTNLAEYKMQSDSVVHVVGMLREC